MLRTTISFLACMFFLGACSQIAPSADDARASIAEVWKRFGPLWLAGDAAGVTDVLFTEDGINVIPDMPTYRGRDALKAAYTDIFKDNKILNFEQKTEQVNAAGDLAIELGTFNQTIQPREGAAYPFNGRYLALWKHQADGSWKCKQFLFNSAPRAQ